MTSSLRKNLTNALEIAVLISLVLSMMPAQPGRAAGTWYVAPGGDDGNTCSIPTSPCATINGAISKAAAGDTVNVAVGTYTGTTTAAVVTINEGLVISGGWSTDFTSQTGKSTIDGEGARRNVSVDNSTVTIDNFMIENGFDADYGGGIYNHNSNLTLSNSDVSNNTAGIGGGAGIVNNFGTLTLNNSVLSENTNLSGSGSAINIWSGNVTINNSTISSNHKGAAIVKPNTGALYINNSTIANNQDASNAGHAIEIYYGNVYINSSTITNNQGAGVYVGGGLAQVQNSILTGNIYGDCVASWYNFSSQGFNIIGTHFACNLHSTDLAGVDPLLGPLQDNGGPTFTEALLTGSPAIEAGNPAGCTGSNGVLLTDQRGFRRIGRCDIGAFEAPWTIQSYMTVTPAHPHPGDSVTYTITIFNGTETIINGVSLTDSLPTSLTYQEGSLVASSGTVAYSAGEITWNGNVDTIIPVTITFNEVVNSDIGCGTLISNTAKMEGAGVTLNPSASFRVANCQVFLPLITKPPACILGHVSLNGSDAPNVLLWLYIYNGSSWIQSDYKSTDSKGNYCFPAASLAPGQKYSVGFLNTSSYQDGRLWEWFTRDLTAYKSGQSVDIGDFDLADVTLNSPGPYTIVSLPQTFIWTKRPATPSDSYIFELFDPYGSADFVTPPLGYVNSYTLTGIPGGFSNYTAYGWTVWVESPDGGIGLAYYYNPVAFSSAGSMAPSFNSMGPKRNPVRLPGQFPIHSTP